MTEIIIELTKDGEDDWGTVVFDLENRQRATGRLVSVSIPSDRQLQTKVDHWLRENPEAVARFGGTMPENIGDTGDGILAVLEVLSLEHRFQFDADVIPLPTFPEGATG